MAAFYSMAGLNHFINSDFYLGLIPNYLGYPEVINYLSGIIEIVFAIGILFSKARKLIAYGIILMLVAFIPSHIYFIQIGSCVINGLCVSPWIAWARILLIHPLLLLWAYKVGQVKP